MNGQRLLVTLLMLFVVSFGVSYLANLRNSNNSNTNHHHPQQRTSNSYYSQRRSLPVTTNSRLAPAPPTTTSITTMDIVPQRNVDQSASAEKALTSQQQQQQQPQKLSDLTRRVVDWTRFHQDPNQQQLPNNSQKHNKIQPSAPAAVVNPMRLRGGHQHVPIPIPPMHAPVQQRKQQQQQQARVMETATPPRAAPVELVQGPIRGEVTTTAAAVVDEKQKNGGAKSYHFRQQFDAAPACHALSPEEVDFTLVTQLSLNRLWMLEHHCTRWGHHHAISIAVFVDENEQVVVTANDIDDQLHNMGCQHVTVQTLSGYSPEEYPVNVLRNMALTAVRTSHVLYVDVDFWESIDLYDNLQHHKVALAADPHLALVVPAFQMARQCHEWRDCRELNIPVMPQSQDELLELMVQRVADAFDPTNTGGHGSTRYRDWLDQSVDELLPIPCVKSNRYEPYLAFRYCQDVPPFQEAFTGYGKNKMTWIMQLRRAGYQFQQVGHSFVVHYPHLDSPARMHWNGGNPGAPRSRQQQQQSAAAAAAVQESSAWQDMKRHQVDATFVEFRHWLTTTVPDQTRLHQCVDAMNDDEKLWVEHT